MTRIPTALHRSYSRGRRQFGPWSIPGLVERWPLSGGKLYTDSGETTPAGAGDPVGAWKGALGNLDLVQATTAKKPTISSTGPGVSFDMVDDLLRTTYALSMSSRWALAMGFFTRDDSDKIKLDELSILPGEFAMRINAGDNRQVVMPGNWKPNSWCMPAITVPQWASSDGKAHYLFYATNGTDYISAYKWSDGRVYFTTYLGGVLKETSVTKSFAAGSPVFIMGRLSSGTLTVYVDGETPASIAGVGTGAGGTWTMYVGQGGANALHLEGSLNLLITNDGSDASAITDRFNGGAGLALGGDQGWLSKVSGNGQTHGENLVLHVGGNAAGTAYQLDTAYNATNLLAGTATGRVDLSSGNYLTTADPGAAADGIAQASWGFTFESDEVANSVGILGRWDAGTDRQFLIRRTGSTTFRVYIASSGADASNYADFTVSLAAGTDYKAIVTYNAGTLAFYYKAKNGTTRKFGTQTAPTPSVGGTIPATLRASALGYTFGGNATGSYADGKLDDIRIWNGKTLTSAEADADLINEPNPAGLSHWWPFDGDGTDVIGGLTASWTGTPTYVDDGRHHLGRMERWLKQGQYYFDGVNDKITHGDYAALDGATYAKIVDIWTPVLPAADKGLWERGSFGTDGQIMGEVTSSGALNIYVFTGATTYAYAILAGFFAEGVPTHYEVEFDGSQATNATRLVVKRSTFDAATGLWSTLSSVAVDTFSATAIPATLTSPSVGTTLTVGARTTPSHWSGGLRDRFACHAGSLPASKTPYESGAASYDIWCDYNGNANNAGLGGATYNGTVTGAIQWYDGRQLAGWSLVSAGETDRATGSVEGSYRIRIKNARWDSGATAMTGGRWSILVAHGEELSPSLSATINNGMASPDFQASGQRGNAYRTITSASNLVALNTTAGEGYFDNLRALQLATVSLSVSTSGVPSRVLSSFSKAGVNLPYVYAAVATDEKLEIGVRNDAGTRTEGSSSGSLTIGAHSLILEYDGASTLKAYIDSVEVASVAVSGAFTGLDRLTLGGLAGFLEGHPFDERIAGEPWLHAGAAFPGFSAIDRKRLHNYLADQVTGLAAV